MNGLETPPVAFHELFGEPLPNGGWRPTADGEAMLATADIIFARDVMTGRDAVCYGVPALERIVRTGKAERLCPLIVELDMDTLELENLLAAVKVVRGRHDYNGGEDA